MRLPLTPALASLPAAPATARSTLADQGGPSTNAVPPSFSLGSFLQDRLGLPYSIGMWGDLPYNDVQKTTGVPNLIADMNSQHLAFTVHDGDLKTGNGAPICDNALYAQATTNVHSLPSPASFPPGDNDCTALHRP